MSCSNSHPPIMELTSAPARFGQGPVALSLGTLAKLGGWTGAKLFLQHPTSGPLKIHQASPVEGSGGAQCPPELGEGVSELEQRLEPKVIVNVLRS